MRQLYFDGRLKRTPPCERRRCSQRALAAVVWSMVRRRREVLCVVVENVELYAFTRRECVFVKEVEERGK